MYIHVFVSTHSSYLSRQHRMYLRTLCTYLCIQRLPRRTPTAERTVGTNSRRRAVVIYMLYPDGWTALRVSRPHPAEANETEKAKNELDGVESWQNYKLSTRAILLYGKTI